MSRPLRACARGILAVALGVATAGSAAAANDYVGSERCGSCHADAKKKWSNSSHAWAMKPNDEAAARAAFDGVVRNLGEGDPLTPSVHETSGARVLRLKGEGAEPEDFELAYFFGRESLEQPLTFLDRGRLQSLPVGFDVRTNDWFHIFPGENRRAEEWGHWTNRGMNANSECLYCHTTGYTKGYDSNEDRYQSHWAEAGVGCEACHGPGRAHVEFRSGELADATGEPYATSEHRVTQETCAPCHSRRGELMSDPAFGTPFLDAFDPALLDSDAFQATGQIAEQEVFEWASYRMSRMHALGVSCMACHDSHSGARRAEGNALCSTCHAPTYAESGHVHHAEKSAGAECVACHMPKRMYMQRDLRRDHSLAVPDPQLSVELGVSNACTDCHKAKTAQWAAKQVAEWFPDSSPAVQERRARRRHDARAIAAGRNGDPDGYRALLVLLESDSDEIRRASAARLLERYLGFPEVVAGLIAAAADPLPLVRGSAIRSLGGYGQVPDGAHSALAKAAVDDERFVRLQAGYALRSWQPTGDEKRAAEEKGIIASLAEWETAARATLERPTALHNLGTFLIEQRRFEEGVEAYRRALQFEPRAVAPRHNLGMFLAEQGRLQEAEAEFETVLRQDPSASPTAFSLGLLYGEMSRWPDAIRAFEMCVAHSPEYPRAYYNLGLAYSKTRDVAAAIENLTKAADVRGSRSSAAQVLAGIYGQIGERDKAQFWAARLAELGGHE